MSAKRFDRTGCGLLNGRGEIEACLWTGACIVTAVTGVALRGPALQGHHDVSDSAMWSSFLVLRLRGGTQHQSLTGVHGKLAVDDKLQQC